MSWRREAAVVVCLLAGLAGAAAQTLPWPGDPPKGDGGSPAPAPAMAAPAAPPPMMAAPAPMMGGRPQGGGQQSVPPCVTEFTRLREDVEKKGAVAKSVNDKRGSREDLCKAIIVMTTAEAKWIKYTEANQASCGIPPDIVKQIKVSHEHMMTVRKKVCDVAAGGAPGPQAPSLSDALGTSQLPARDNTTTKRGGTLDTLTGNPIR